ncbi:lipocalin [Caulobacter sp. B11]|uniref:lipocalin family protein n=1 Tax=Caulobacter sp. B11 TaxID=2048899 RepID=UPI000C129CF4|nr:lipocalin family protein [Caulobacter sp. B11]PHY14043.1 lipocalin [Caulobacter sp. B11]
MRNSVSTFLAGLLLVTCSGTAMAGARPPAKPVSLAFYSGKWFEISRTPNAGQRDCEAATTQFTSTGDDAFKVVQVCRKGSASGPAKIFTTRGTILTGTGNAKFSMSFLGGLKKQEYWVLDRADDQSWAIMATPGGNYVWLLARQAVMTPAAKAVALARVRSLGYAKLEFPAHPAK